MNMEAEIIHEPLTPASTRDNTKLWSTEDSGYTSFTPGSIECSELSNENLYPKSFTTLNSASIESQNDSFQLLSSPKRRKIARFKSCGDTNSRLERIPTLSSIRRGKKRHFEEDDGDRTFNSVPTPTSYIAGGIQRLHVNETSDVDLSRKLCTVTAQSISNVYSLENYNSDLLYPTTPVKKICRSNCKLSPSSYNYTHKSSPPVLINTTGHPRRSAKKLNFGLQSQSAETATLKLLIEKSHLKPCQPKAARSIFRPDQKVDIIKLLHQKRIPAINKIFSYLDSKDIYNFSLVSPVWLQACEEVNKAKCMRKKYMEYINNAKENCDSREKEKNNDTSRIANEKSTCSLRDINNIINSRKVQTSPKRSPPGTPRTIRFKKFVKSGSLDSRMQLSCIHCRGPAKVTKESTGEEWVECTNKSCAFQYCKFCNCPRHPTKKCYLYDLEQPSPSKKKKATCIIGTEKSRKNLRRLL